MAERKKRKRAARRKSPYGERPTPKVFDNDPHHRLMRGEHWSWNANFRQMKILRSLVGDEAYIFVGPTWFKRGDEKTPPEEGDEMVTYNEDYIAEYFETHTFNPRKPMMLFVSYPGHIYTWYLLKGKMYVFDTGSGRTREVNGGNLKH